MSKEPRSNIGMVCPEHAPRPNKELIKGKSPEDFISKFVKKAFTVPGEETLVEHMWIWVQEVVDGKLAGRLDNTPIYNCGVKYKDRIVLGMEEIEDVLD